METSSYEIDEGADYLGFPEALQLVCSNARPLGTEEIPLELSNGRIAAEDATALSSYPSADISLKDGFAVKSEEVVQASRRQPVSLRIAGSAFAGSSLCGRVESGSAVKVCSGAPIPAGADAVVPGELCVEISEAEVHILADAETGRNVLPAGIEVTAGSTIVREGSVFLPGNMGLAAAAGISRVRVCRRARVAVVGVGDEIVAPGGFLRPSQIYASNLVTLRAWLNSFGVDSVLSVVRDDVDAIGLELERQLPAVDVILTSGGAWGSERDLVIGTLGRLGWQEIFHHVRMGPGKGIAFGLWKNNPVFCLPGGPASNEMAFLQLALPGILRMSGDMRHPLPSVRASLTEDLRSRHPAWTEFKDAVLSRDSTGSHTVAPYRNRSRLQAIAGADSLICIPEGIQSLSCGEIVPVQVLVPHGNMI